MRAAYKEQAKALLEGKETWRPTWKALGLEPHKSFKSKKGEFVPAATLPAFYHRGRKHSA